MRQVEVGYSATDWSPDQLLPALNAISSAGFAGIEVGTDIAQIFEGRVDEFTGLLDLVGLRLAAVSAGFILTDLAYATLDAEVARQAVDFASQAGDDVRVVAIPGDYAGDATEGVRQAAWGLGRVADIAAKKDVRVCVRPTRGSPIVRKSEVALLMDLTEKRKDHLGICLDTAHLLLGGCEPLAVISSWPERIWHVYLTDLRIGEARGQSLLVEPGTGTVDLRGIAEAIRNSSYEGWVMGRVDTPTLAPKESAQACARYFGRTLALPVRSAPAQS